MRIAIVGAAPGAAAAPYTDPSWSVWALPWRNRTPGISAYFEMHDRGAWGDDKGQAYRNFLASLTVPVYMISRQADIPASLPYPLADVVDAIGRDYFTSSIAFMLGLAICKAPDEIGLWGVDMAAVDEYRDQRPCVEWLLGIAQGAGIKVTLPQGCPLLMTPRRYGT